jgi:plastocyanin
MTQRTFAPIGVLAACAAALACCQADRPAPPPPRPQSAAAATETAKPEDAGPAGEPGNIEITVLYKGAAPEVKTLNRSADPYCAKTEKTDPSLLVSGDKVVNAIVRVTDRVKGKFDAPAEPVVLAQHECMYVPRVAVAQDGQQVSITNGDKTLHNVHAYKGDNKANWFNSAQPPNAPALAKSLASGVVQFKCDVHPWMSAFIYVSDHPFQGVTREDGKVTMTGVPSRGKPYTLKAWHEVLGEREVSVVVEAGKTSQVQVEFAAL